MTDQNFHKNTNRHRKNSEWLQCLENSEKPENETKIKIPKFQENHNKPILLQGLEQSYKVTQCNEKCNFFILLQPISLIRILSIGIIPFCRHGISLLVQFLNLIFYRRGMPNGIHTVDSGIPIPDLTFLMKTNMSKSMNEKNRKRHKIHHCDKFL